MKQFTSQVPPGANESNFITVSVLINTEQIRYQWAKALFIYEMIPEYHYLGNKPLCGKKNSSWLLNSGTPHTPDSSLPSLCPFWVTLICAVRWARLSSFLLITLDHHGAAKHKIWQAKPAVIHWSLGMILSGEIIRWFHINPASSELTNTEPKALPGQVHSFGRVTVRTDVPSCEITGSVWFDQGVAVLSGGLTVKGPIWH